MLGGKMMLQSLGLDPEKIEAMMNGFMGHVEAMAQSQARSEARLNQIAAHLGLGEVGDANAPQIEKED